MSLNDAPAPAAPRSPPSRLDVVLSLIVGANLAVAQPLLDILGRNPEFFVARDAPVLDVALVALGPTIVAPLAGAAVILLVRRLHRPAANALHGLALATLGAVFALQLLKRAIRGPGALVVAAAVVAGVGVALAFLRWRGPRLFVRWASPAPLVVAAVFLFGSPVSKLVLPQPVTTSTARVEVGEPAPLVLVVLDELPVSSLMDAEGKVDEALFPNFARLSRDGVWFRNATTVHQSTPRAVPAILTGRIPPEGSLPIPSDHPQTLFTLLQGRYRIEAAEPITHLCSGGGCNVVAQPRERPLVRWKRLIADLRVVGLHLVLPADLTEGLPAIDQTWGSFGGTAGAARSPPARTQPPATQQPPGAQESPGLQKPPARPRSDLRKRFKAAVSTDRGAWFLSFADTVRRTDRPTLWFAHAMLPHVPWQYLPNGQRYTDWVATPGVGRTMTSDRWLAAQAYQRHLLQVQFVDTLIGRLIARMEAAGIYRDAMMIVTADHGASFRTGRLRREAARDTAGDVGAVPLFVKLPGATRTGIDDRPAQTIDILPTVADVLDIRGAAPMDGISLLAKDFPRDRRRVVRWNDGTRVPLSADGREKFALVDEKYRLFGGKRSLDVWRLGEHADLVGRSVSSLGIAGSAPLRATVDTPFASVDVDPRAPDVPCFIAGTLRGSAETADIAVVVNGKVAAVTRTVGAGGSGSRFYAIFPPEMLRAGRNRLELLHVGRSPQGRTFLRIPS